MLHNCTLHFVRLFHLKSFEKQEKEEKRAREQTEPDFYGFFCFSFDADARVLSCTKLKCVSDREHRISKSTVFIISMCFSCKLTILRCCSERKIKRFYSVLCVHCSLCQCVHSFVCQPRSNRRQKKWCVQNKTQLKETLYTIGTRQRDMCTNFAQSKTVFPRVLFFLGCSIFCVVWLYFCDLHIFVVFFFGGPH